MDARFAFHNTDNAGVGPDARMALRPHPYLVAAKDT
jgi:hypothetical protein